MTLLFGSIEFRCSHATSEVLFWVENEECFSWANFQDVILKVRLPPPINVCLFWGGDMFPPLIDSPTGWSLSSSGFGPTGPRPARGNPRSKAASADPNLPSTLIPGFGALLP